MLRVPRQPRALVRVTGANIGRCHHSSNCCHCWPAGSSMNLVSENTTFLGTILLQKDTFTSFILVKGLHGDKGNSNYPIYHLSNCQSAITSNSTYQVARDRMAPESSTFGAFAHRVVYHTNAFYPAIAQKNSGCQGKERMIHCVRLVRQFIFYSLTTWQGLAKVRSKSDQMY